MKSINSKPIKIKIETMLDRLSRVNVETLSPEELTRYENLVNDLQIKLQDNQKITKGVRYIEHVLADSTVLELNQDLSNLSQVVSDANQYLSTL